MKPRKMKLGTYVELIYDDKMRFAGLDWYHLQGGFAQEENIDRDDWVADVPGVSVSITGRNGRWGLNDYGSREEAMAAEVRAEADHVQFSVRQATEKLADLVGARRRLDAAAKRLEKR